MRLGKCKACGKSFVRKHPAEKYCTDDCRQYMRQHQNRVKSIRWYHKNKHRLTEKQRWGLGSGYLHSHRNPNYALEKKSINNEFHRLKLKPQR